MAERPVAVVTGAASGIGRQIAIRLAAKGYELAAVDVDSAALATLSSDVQGCFQSFDYDVTDADAWEALAQALADRRVGLLVNAAGVLLAGRCLDCAAVDLRRVVDVNLVGPMLGCRAIAPLLVKTVPELKRRERPLPVGVLNVASVFATIAPPAFAAYNASKAGLVTFSQTLRAELRGARVNVTTVLPGVAPTGLFDRARYADPTVKRATRVYLESSDLTPEAVAEGALRALRRRRALVTLGRRARRFTWAKRLAPGFTGWLVARQALRALSAPTPGA